jgi:hypothetical protein
MRKKIKIYDALITSSGSTAAAHKMVSLLSHHFYNRRIRLNIAIGFAFALALLLTLVLGFTSARHVTKILEGVETHAGGIRAVGVILARSGRNDSSMNFRVARARR